MLYNIVCATLRVVLRAVFRFEVKGRDNIIKEGGGIVAVNHRSNWDVMLVAMLCPRTLRFMAKAELFENKIFGGLLTKLGAFPIQRGKGDIGAIKGALKILRGNDLMLMFPEGHRIRDGKRTKAKAGVSTFAIMAKVPVIPIHIYGDYKWMRKITISFGEPIAFDEYYGQKLPADKLQELADGVMDTIYSLE